MINWRRIARVFFKIVLPAAIIVAVGWQFALILRRPELWDVDFPCRIEWFLPAALLYLICHSIWATFWVLLLRHQGFHTSYPTGLRAYFISQYGKYIPGKVWVILIRIVMLGASRKDKAIVGVTATYETLTSMAAGALLGLLLLHTLKIDLQLIKGFAALNAVLNYVLIIVGLVPIGLGLLHRLIVRVVRWVKGPDAPPIPNMNMLLLGRGLLQASAAYFLLGLSLWMTVQAILPQPTGFTWNDLLRLTAITNIAYVVGFIAFFLPGGVGAREYVFAVLLAAELEATGMSAPIAEGLAVVITLVLRLIWTIAELVLALLLYRFIPATERPSLTPAVKELVE